MVIRNLFLFSLLLFTFEKSICHEASYSGGPGLEEFLYFQEQHHKVSRSKKISLFIKQIFASYCIHFLGLKGTQALQENIQQRFHDRHDRVFYLYGIAFWLAAQFTFDAQAYITADTPGQEPSNLAHAIGAILALLTPVISLSRLHAQRQQRGGGGHRLGS